MVSSGLETRRSGQVIMHGDENREVVFYYYLLLGPVCNLAIQFLYYSDMYILLTRDLPTSAHSAAKC